MWRPERGSRARSVVAVGVVAVAAAGAAARAGSGAGGPCIAAVGDVKTVTAFDGADSDRFGQSVAIDGDYLAVGSPQDDDAGFGSGSVYIYRRDLGGPDAWGLVKKIVAPDGAAGDGFGTALDMRGGTLVVGAPGDDSPASNAGSAYVFVRDSGGADNWGFVRKVLDPGGASGDTFGVGICVSGDECVIGAGQDDAPLINSGSASVFSRDIGGPDNWGFVKRVVAPDGAVSDAFGFSVSMSGDVLAVGAAEDDDAGSNSGSAYVFGRDVGGAGNWGFVKKIVAPDAQGADAFGRSIGVDGGTLVCGANQADSISTASGAAYVYERNAGGADNWGFVRKIEPPPGSSTIPGFGLDVCLRGDWIVVGAPTDNVGAFTAGTAHVHLRDLGGADSWGLVRSLAPPSTVEGRGFGESVAIDGSTIAVGATFDPAPVALHGSARIFAVVPPCVGDLNCDALVDTGDLGLVLGDFGVSAGPYDINGDGITDTADLGLLIGAFGSACAP